MSAMPERIDTPRLLLRRWTVDDAPELRALLDANDAHLRPWIPFMQHEPRSLDATRSWLAEIVAAFDAGTAWRYAIHRGPACVGETMLLDRVGPDGVEAGYWLAAEHCGQGFAHEATAALLGLAFGVLGRARVVMRCDARNGVSIRVAERLGAVHVGDEQLAENGEPVTLRVYERRLDR